MWKIIFIFLSIFAMFTVSQINALADGYIIVIGDDVNIRLEPNTNSTVIAKSQKGDIFRVADMEGDWYSIYMFSGEKRYIFKSLTDKINAVPELTPSIETKKKVYRELSDAKVKAANESYAKYPKDIFKQIDLERRLNDSYKLPAFQKHTIPPANYHKLMGEGLKNNW